MQPIISVKNVTKSFGEVKALRGVSLEVQPGSIYALLGPNGAGKTTLIRILATLAKADSGTVTVAGFSVEKQAEKVRERIGLAGQFAAVDDFLTGRETLEMVARLYHLPRAEGKKRAAALLEQLSLTEAADRPARTYSGGMRRRLDLGASLVVEPEIIFLDEPTTGLDPATRLELWEVIRRLARNGSTILLTTQYLEEADALADYIMVIDKGAIAIEGTANELKKSLGQDVVEVKFSPSLREKASALLGGMNLGEINVDEHTGSLRIPAKLGSKTLLIVAEALQKAKLEPEEISLHRPSLDDVFLSVTGKKTKSVAAAKSTKRKR
jgi:ABC-2 type transport system ATP-binding protein